MIDLAGRRCVVSGATGGIGRALVFALARGGGHVYAVGRSQDRLVALVREVGEAEGGVTTVLADLSRDGDVERAAREVLLEAERVDVLIHGAGAIALGSVDSTAIAALDQQYGINVRAPVALTKALLPGLRAARGQVVFINSSAALRPVAATNVMYAATKAALKTFADGLRDEVSPDGIRVVTVFAGRTATPMQESVHAFEARSYRPELLLRPEDVVEVVLGALALPRSAEVTDVSVRPMRKPTDA